MLGRVQFSVARLPHTAGVPCGQEAELIPILLLRSSQCLILNTIPWMFRAMPLR